MIDGALFCAEGLRCRPGVSWRGSAQTATRKSPNSGLAPRASHTQPPEGTRYQPIRGRCNQQFAIDEPRPNQQTAHGRCYQAGCANISRGISVGALPGWWSTSETSRQQTAANLQHLLEPPAAQRIRVDSASAATNATRTRNQPTGLAPSPVIHQQSILQNAPILTQSKTWPGTKLTSYNACL